jgi:hypothetical protein
MACPSKRGAGENITAKYFRAVSRVLNEGEFEPYMSERFAGVAGNFQ